MWESHAPSPLGPYFAGAAFFHAFFIVLSAQAAHGAPPETLEVSQQEEIRRYLAAADERTVIPDQVFFGGEGESRGRNVNDQAGNGALSGGTRASGREGKMGSPTSRGVGGRHASEKGEKGAPVEMSPQEALADAREFGMVGIAAEDGSRFPVTTWGRGGDGGLSEWSAKEGALWGGTVGDSYGAGGLGLSGIGEGGGGRGEGIGLGSIGTIGHTWGDPGDGTGGGGTPRPEWSGGWFVAYVPHNWRPRRKLVAGMVRMGSVSVVSFGTADSSRPTKVAAGDMYRESARRVVRQQFGRLRLCYDTFLGTGPKVTDGSITVSILVGRQGTVLSSGSVGATVGGTTLPLCASRSFLGSLFAPPPGDGTAIVTVPLVFTFSPPTP